ncbi:MAG: hypothetical protein ACP5VE_01180 [Chthonomonadales bacterium]
MKQNISAPAAIAIAVIVLGIIGFFLWRHYFAGPFVVDTSPGLSMNVTHPPRTKEEGMRLYRGAGQPGAPH